MGPVCAVPKSPRSAIAAGGPRNRRPGSNSSFDTSHLERPTAWSRASRWLVQRGLRPLPAGSPMSPRAVASWPTALVADAPRALLDPGLDPGTALSEVFDLPSKSPLPARRARKRDPVYRSLLRVRVLHCERGVRGSRRRGVGRPSAWSPAASTVSRERSHSVKTRSSRSVESERLVFDAGAGMRRNGTGPPVPVARWFRRGRASAVGSEGPDYGARSRPVLIASQDHTTRAAPPGADGGAPVAGDAPSRRDGGCLVRAEPRSLLTARLRRLFVPCPDRPLVPSLTWARRSPSIELGTAPCGWY